MTFKMMQIAFLTPKPGKGMRFVFASNTHNHVRTAKNGRSMKNIEIMTDRFRASKMLCLWMTCKISCKRLRLARSCCNRGFAPGRWVSSLGTRFAEELELKLLLAPRQAAGSKRRSLRADATPPRSPFNLQDAPRRAPEAGDAAAAAGEPQRLWCGEDDGVPADGGPGPPTSKPPARMNGDHVGEATCVGTPCSTAAWCHVEERPRGVGVRDGEAPPQDDRFEGEESLVGVLPNKVGVGDATPAATTADTRASLRRECIGDARSEDCAVERSRSVGGARHCAREPVGS
mmetsp:Transcript_123158/g.353823  ORF Transcript_123158/g.353823 Transcript_123158/m.353823 type:complete len:288 (-) Transcript_123158:1004-1867(-)